MRRFNETEIFLNADPAQKILWEYITQRFGENISVTKYFYQGGANSSPITVYSANRIWLAYEFKVSQNRSVQSASDLCQFYDELNVLSFFYTNSTAFWDTTAALVKTFQLSFSLTNLFFGRVALAVPTNGCIFNGFQIGR